MAGADHANDVVAVPRFASVKPPANPVPLKPV